MLQQNSYCPSRYFRWIKGSYSGTLLLTAAVFCAETVLYSFDFYITQLILSSLLLILRAIRAIKAHKSSIKPLKFTKRVIRLYIGAAIPLIFLSVSAAAARPSLFGEMCLCTELMLSCLTPVLCLAAWCLTFPAEKLFGLYYKTDARKILKSNKQLTVVGVTGSYGKTTVKFILNRILSEKYNVLCTPQSYNTPLGIIRTVREKMRPQTQIFICEMGAKNKGDIKEICNIVNPKYGIITSVGKQHLETFKTEDNVFKTKFELCDAVEKNGGVCLAFADSDGIKARVTQKPYATLFGANTDYFVSDVKTGPSGSSFRLHLNGETVAVKTKLLGAHSIADILAAAAMAHILGVSGDDIKAAVASLVPTEHRLQLKPFVNGALLIDDAYNSNPEGCLEAARVLGSFEGMRKTVITPGLIELGEREYECNYNLGLACAEHADKIILVGKNRSKPLYEAVTSTDFDKQNLYVAESFKAALEIFSGYAEKGDVLLIENDLPDNYLN